MGFLRSTVIAAPGKIRRVKRFLSATNTPSSPRRRSYGRQASDSSMFFPSRLSPTGIQRLQEALTMPRPLGSTPVSKGKPQAALQPGRAVHHPRDQPESTVQREGLPHQKRRRSPRYWSQPPKHHRACGRARPRYSNGLHPELRLTGVQPSRPGQQGDPVGSVPFSFKKGVPLGPRPDCSSQS